MGHTRLGEIPKSQKWSNVVAYFATGAQIQARQPSISEVASRTLEATQTGLAKASRDPGLRYVFYLLTQVALASRAEDWRSALRRTGVHLSDEATVFDFSSAFQDAVDQRLRDSRYDSDVSEIAQRSATETIVELAGAHTRTLFGNNSQELKHAVRQFSTTKGFAVLGQRFFSRFLARYLNFYLSRVTAANVGTAHLQQIGDVTRFNEELRLHCEQSSRIVRDFCGQWYSKTEYEQGIDQKNTNQFIAIALKKLSSELQRQKEQS